MSGTKKKPQKIKKPVKRAAPRTEHEKRKRQIVERMQKLGIYKVQYVAAINRLADLYLRLDELAAQYKESGEGPIVLHTNKAGATNAAANPYLQMMLQIQTQALAHERELGLTPQAMRKIGSQAEEEEDFITKAMKALKS